MYRACLTTFAPILINLVIKVRNEEWLIDLGRAKRHRELPQSCYTNPYDNWATREPLNTEIMSLPLPHLPVLPLHCA